MKNVYNALDEDHIIQELRNSAARMHRVPRGDHIGPNRRWWRRRVRSAR